MDGDSLGDGFGAFAAARIPSLLRFGFALTGSTVEAEDLVQEALGRVAPRWRTVTAAGAAEPYVQRTMVNLHVSWWRSRRRERLHADPPDRAVTDTLPNRDVWVALRTLPPRQRAVLALRYFEDLTEGETAAVLGCSVGTVKSQTAKAIAKLRPTLDKNTLLETPRPRLKTHCGGRWPTNRPLPGPLTCLPTSRAS